VQFDKSLGDVAVIFSFIHILTMSLFSQKIVNVSKFYIIR